MNKTGKLIFTILLTLALAFTMLACTTDDDVDYANVEDITVDETSIADGFLVSEFNISKVLLNVKYYDTVDNMGSTVPGETVQIPATMNMVKASDKAKLSVPGTHTVTLIYRRFTISFVLVLRDSSQVSYRVTFLDENGARLGDVQNVSAGGRALQPALPTKPGYVFLGWMDRETQSLSTFDNIVKDTVFQAVYAPDKYKVKFMSKINGQEELIEEISVPRGENALNYAPDIPIKEGYSNGRWEDEDAMKNVSSEGLVFYAVYDADKVNVSFRYMRFGAAYSVHNVSYAVGSEIKNPPEAARDGYKFVEWRVDGKKVEFPYTVTTEITFDAVYININEGNAGLSYTETQGGVEISGYAGEEDVVVIPKEVVYEGNILPVVSIQNGVFVGKNIKEFAVANDNEIFTTEDNVLFNREKTELIAYPVLKSGNYIVPETVVEIRPYAFYGAKSLLSVAFNDSLVRIGDYAFAECDLLTEINISKSVGTIGEGAFYCSEGSSLNNVNFDKALALRVIKDKAFYGAEAVRSIALPSTLEELGSAVFGGCKLLGEITAMNSGFFTVVNGGLYSADKKILYSYPALYGAEGGASSASVYNPEISIDATCSRILSGAFSYTKISSVIIKSSLKVDEGAFYCPTLRRVYIDAESAELYSGSFAFEPSIILNADKMSAEKQAEISGRFPGRVSVYDKDEWEGVRDFENNYIYELYKYTDTVNGNTVIKDGVRILGSRQSSPQLHIPSTLSNYSVTAIADYAFYGDNTIEKVYLPSDLRVIGKKAFGNMGKLDEVTFNDVVEEIGDYAFAGSKNLSSINYGDGMTKVVSFGAGVFENTAFIENDNNEFLTVGNVLVKYTGFSTAVEIPDDIGYIASDAFVNHGEITSVEFGDSLSIIDSRAFQYCEGIKEIFLPSSVRIIREYAFYYCSDLFSVNFGVSKTDSALSVDGKAFYGVYSESGAVLIYTDSEQFTITYRIDSSDSYSSRGVAIVKAHTVDNSTRNRFAGWYEDEALTIPAKFPRKLEENVTVYAKWIGINESSVGIVYRLTEDDTYAVSGYEGTDTYVIVPDTYMGKSVKEIDDRAFYGKNVLSIELPNNKNYDGSMSSQLNKIGEDAFEDTGWYESYSGDFVMIDDFLVKYKGKSSVVYIPDNVHKIAKGAFKNNGYIEKVVFSEGVSELADEIFYGCVSLKEAVLPKGLLTIGHSVFSGCTELSDINFSDCKNLSSIGYDAFDGTEWLEGYVDPCVMINTTLYRYKGNMRSLHIYNGVTSIGERAFYGNVALKNVYIPQSVTNIGESAFENSAVEEVNLYAGGSKLSLIQKRAFYDAAYLTVLDLSLAPGLGYIGEYAFYGCKQLKTVEIPAGTANMGSHAFEESGINSVTFASGSKLTAIADYAFNGCKSLHKVNFVGASSLTSIGDYAFYNCISLEYFDNGKGSLTSIGDYAFYGCSSLSKFYINEETLAEIGDNALESVGYSTSEQGFVVLGNILLGYDGYETEVTIPDNITTIYNGAFAGNTRVKKVIFDSKSAITNVNSEAFRDCANLKEINFPDSIRFVGDNVVTGTAWYNDQVRDGKEFIVIANTLIKYNGSEVKRVVIPQEVSVINRGAFDGCAVFDVCIGENVLTIEDGAFSGVDTVTFEEWTVTILGSVPPVIKESARISAKYVLIGAESQKDMYRLDAGWQIQFELVKVAEKHRVTYSVKEGEGKPVEAEDAYALYEEKEVETLTDGERSYIFVGWYFDETLINAVTYPFVLSSDITLYAKCIDNTTGSNGEDYQVSGEADDKIIELYLGESDNKIVIISTMSSNPIKRIESGWIYDEINGTHTRNGDEYILDSVNGKYRRVGAFECHNELNEVYFALGSQITTIGKDAFKGCENLTKIVLPASIRTIESGAFANCTSLKEIVFTGECDGLTIKSGAFENCTSLEKITLPAGLTGLEDKAFSGCVKLKDIFVEAEIAVPINKDDRPFEIIDGMRIHIKSSAMSSYSASWEAYAKYLVTIEEE